MKFQIKYKISKKIMYMVLLGVIMMCSSWLMYFYDPLQLIVRKLLQLSPGTILFNIWSTPPYDVVMKLYIFNVTNAEQFLKGEEKLNVTQVGPYAYKEILTNNNATFAADGTVTFTPRRDYVLDRENSVGDAKIDRIIIPNVPLLGFQAFLQDASIFTNLGFYTISRSAEPILNITVDEYLWGYEDSLVTMANNFLPNWIDFDKFGIMERLMNRDNSNRVTIMVDPSKKNSIYENLLTQEEQSAPFHVVKWNGSPGLKEWGYQEKNDEHSTKRCELVEGTFDGTIFPRKMKKNTSITLFRKAFCRPVPFEFIEQSTTKQGFNSYNYKMKEIMFASPEVNPSNECYCFKNMCPAKGLQTVAPCYYGMPIVLSQPHFLNSDPDIINAVNGMEPDEEKHSSVAKIQPDLGVPLDESTLKIQINLGIDKPKMNMKTKAFNHLTIPLVWIELTCNELPALIAFLVTLIVDVLPVLQNVLIYLLGLIGLAMISGAALLTLFFTKTIVPRSLSIAAEYSPIPLIQIPTQYLKPELKICKG